MLFPEAGVGESEGEGVGIAVADEGFELGELRFAVSRAAASTSLRKVRMLAAEPIIWSTVARSAQERKPRSVAISSRAARRSRRTCWLAG